jgi:hypothetical protein
LLGLALPAAAQAQQAAQSQPANLVPLKFAYVSTGDSTTIPVSPPIVPTSLVIIRGQADYLGPITGMGHVINHLGADGNLAYNDGGVLVLNAVNGDAVFFTFVGVVRPSTRPGTLTLEEPMIITGGKGRFLGATGSGVLNLVVDFSNGQATGTFAGMITAPKP